MLTARLMKFLLIGKSFSFLVEGEKPLLAYCVNATLHCRSVGKKTLLDYQLHYTQICSRSISNVNRTILHQVPAQYFNFVQRLSVPNLFCVNFLATFPKVLKSYGIQQILRLLLKFIFVITFFKDFLTIWNQNAQRTARKRKLS